MIVNLIRKVGVITHLFFAFSFFKNRVGWSLLFQYWYDTEPVFQYKDREYKRYHQI